MRTQYGRPRQGLVDVRESGSRMGKRVRDMGLGRCSVSVPVYVSVLLWVRRCVDERERESDSELVSRCDLSTQTTRV